MIFKDNFNWPRCVSTLERHPTLHWSAQWVGLRVLLDQSDNEVTNPNPAFRNSIQPLTLLAGLSWLHRWNIWSRL